ncbi:hypothetical protein NM688_g8965 [Phlebia brevispora]|uniref:Uncharacterized protein n=1 Tax=Phlebia brevispora TaxID=194682 RepID=A0ACC1RMZ5_9APHY|nr:hypothetical protein NM688_g8965 [Phlebia brevispora]
MPQSRSQLLASAQALCTAFANQAPLDELLTHFSTTHQVSAHEHGLPCLAPFLGRTFTGRTGPHSVEAYFKLLQQLLIYQDMRFGDWTVDTEARKVCAKGKARFTWIDGKGKGQWWDEQFIYMLDFDDEGKVTDYQVWADSGAAYLARKGELNSEREKYEDIKGSS